MHRGGCGGLTNLDGQEGLFVSRKTGFVYVSTFSWQPARGAHVPFFLAEHGDNELFHFMKERSRSYNHENFDRNQEDMKDARSARGCVPGKDAKISELAPVASATLNVN